MKKLLMLGTVLGSVEIIKRAKSMGIYTIVTDYREPAFSKAKMWADEYWMIDTSDLDELEKKCREAGVNGVISAASDFNCGQAIKLCERMGISRYCNSSTWNYSINKFAFKKACRECGVSVAKDYYLSDKPTEAELRRISYPVVVKPADQSGNAGVSYCHDRKELLQAYEYAKSLTSCESVLVEQMLCGQEYNVYYAMADGDIRLINAATEHHEPGYPANLYSIITSVTDYVDKFNKEINPQIIELLKKIGCREGIGWLELILNEDGKFYVIEMGYRFGGDMMCTAFDKVCGFDAIKWMIECAIGEQHDSSLLPEPQKNQYRKCVCSYGFFTLRAGVIGSIEGVDEISRIPGMTVDFMKNKGDFVKKYCLIGEIVFHADDCEEMIVKLNRINQLLRVTSENEENMIIYYTDFPSLVEMYHSKN